MVISVLVVCPRDRMPDWELQLAAAAQYHKIVSYHMLLAQKKIKIQTLVSTKWVLLLYYHKVEKS